ncbi:Lrp/AsnC family transcriptional regulator [Prescottella subtropica]|uniref:Lrp/AsnC family transcriptional regulator n=1 Tax=Prescottella subtropica TaxID=2545757 RepID=UPI0010F76112|nr:Lrp/AsnC family transcriptional regulator [Prescottella subtropica]
MNNQLMQEYDGLDETDLRLVNALQFEPRASWTTVGAALGIDPVTAARRWAHLVASGSAWVTAHPAGPQTAALVEVECVAGATRDTAEQLSRRPHVLTVEHASGAYGLLLTVSVADVGTLSQLLLDIESMTGIRSTRSNLVIRPFALGGDWQVRALDVDQRGRLTASSRRGRSSLHPLDATDRKLMACLFEDGRASLTDLAERLGCSVSTARRRLDALLGRNALLRCDIAQPLSGWPMSVSMWARVPADDCDDVGRRLVALPETRACLALTGAPANLYHSVWVRSLGDVHRVEATLRRTAPTLDIVGRTVTLRTFKRMGRILDEYGRSVETVPMDVWAAPVSAPRGTA